MVWDITELLEHELKRKREDICVGIETDTDYYHFFFIEYEDEDIIAGYANMENGTEKFMIIYKKNIIHIEVIYKDEIEEALLPSDPVETDKMFH